MTGLRAIRPAPRRGAPTPWGWRALGLLAMALLVFAGCQPAGQGDFQDIELTPGAIEEAFEQGRGDVWVTQRGEVSRILRDDTKGSRHQRFIVRLPSGQTVLIAHNIDLAPRVANIAKGDTIVFRGEYEWNDKGGVVHWTHHDPRGRREGGWLQHGGRRYE